MARKRPLLDFEVAAGDWDCVTVSRPTTGIDTAAVVIGFCVFPTDVVLNLCKYIYIWLHMIFKF